MLTIAPETITKGQKMGISSYFKPEFTSNIINYFLNNPHKTTTLTVEDDKGRSLYTCSAKDEPAINHYIHSRNCSLLEAIIFPVRTDSITHLAKDLFPLAHRSLQINNVALKVIASFGAFIGDCLTLPIRLLTTIPRIIYNALYKHPLARLDALHFPININIVPRIPGWVRVPYLNFWIPGLVSSQPLAKRLADDYAKEQVKALQRALETGAVTVVVRTTEEKDRFTLRSDYPVQIVTTTRYQVHTKPTLDPQRVEQTFTTYKPFSFWGKTHQEFSAFGKTVRMPVIRAAS